MLIYDFSGRGTHPLYEYLYHCLKADILNGRIPAGTKLPSKRELAADNQISVRTVMNAYDQLLTEGYITSEEKRGYFAAKLETAPERSSISACSVSAPERTADRNFASEDPEPLYKEDTWYADFTSNNTIYEKFPFLPLAQDHAGGFERIRPGAGTAGSFSRCAGTAKGYCGLSVPLPRHECFTGMHCHRCQYRISL